jgi:hypothetical protein
MLRRKLFSRFAGQKAYEYVKPKIATKFNKNIDKN